MPDNQLSLPTRRLLTVTFQQGLGTRRDFASLAARISIRCHNLIPRLPPAVVIILISVQSDIKIIKFENLCSQWSRISCFLRDVLVENHQKSNFVSFAHQFSSPSPAVIFLISDQSDIKNIKFDNI